MNIGLETSPVMLPSPEPIWERKYVTISILVMSNSSCSFILCSSEAHSLRQHYMQT